MRIGVDIDDVLYPWFDMAHEACTRAGLGNGVMPTGWHCWESYGCTKEEWLEVIDKVVLDGSLYNGAPIEYAIPALIALAQAGHTIHLVTARGFFANGHLIRRHTIEWLDDWAVPHDTLTFAKDKTLVQTDVFVDDSWKNVQELVAVGVPTWMVDAPHNQGVEYAHRVASFVEFADTILAMEDVA